VAVRARNDALASAKQDLARASAAVFTSASPMNLVAAKEGAACVHVVRLQEYVVHFISLRLRRSRALEQGNVPAGVV